MRRNAVVVFGDSYGASMRAKVRAAGISSSVPEGLAALGEQVDQCVDADNRRAARALALVDAPLAQREVVEQNLDPCVEGTLHETRRAALAHAQDAVLDQEEDHVMPFGGKTLGQLVEVRRLP